MSNNSTVADNLAATGLFPKCFEFTPQTATTMASIAGVGNTEICMAIPRSSFTYRDGTPSDTDYFANGEKLGRTLQESLNKWWNTTIPGSTDYTAAKAANFGLTVGSFQVSSPTVLKRRYTVDIFYKSTNLESNTD